MSKTTNEQRIHDALGVLPVESVLAHEHDKIHGETLAFGGEPVTAVITKIPIRFVVADLIAPSGFAHRLLREWATREAGARDSRIFDAPLGVEKGPPHDAVARYVLRTLTPDHRENVHAALRASLAAREAYAAPPATSLGNDARSDYRISADILDADTRLAAAIVPHLNYLLQVPAEGDGLEKSADAYPLERALENEPAFAAIIEAGAVDALGDDDETTPFRLRRMLLEVAFEGQIRRLRDIRLAKVYEATRRNDTAALCLSGGGIRSATFALGVLSGLAQNGLLGKFDYLSTVSGGGYAGSWLSAWMHHAGTAEVHEELRRADREKLAPDPVPLRHLRAYSHFLAPTVGTFSTDTWTLVASIGRNMMLNWLVLVPIMMAALLVPRLFVSILRVGYGELPILVRDYARELLLLLFTSGLALGIGAAAYVHRNRPEEEKDLSHDESSRGGRGSDAGTQREFLIRCFAPMALAALVLTTALYLWWTWGSQEPKVADLIFGRTGADAAQSLANDPRSRIEPVLSTIKSHPGLIYAFLGAGLLMHLGGWLLSGRARRHANEVGAIILSGLLAGAAGLFMGVWFLARPDTLGRESLYVTLAPPAFLVVMLVGSQLFTALTSFASGDSEREWVTRFNAWLLIAIVLWTSACALVTFGPKAVSEGWSALQMAGLGGLSGALGIFLARSASNSRPGTTSSFASMARRVGMALAAPVFAVSIVVAFAAANEGLIGSACNLPAASDLLKCLPLEPRKDDLSRSQPFVVLARHTTEMVDSVSRQFKSTGADDALLGAFLRADTAATTLRGDTSSAKWDSLLGRLVADASLKAQGTLETDRKLLAEISFYTALVLHSDSATVRGLGGDTTMRSLFARRGRAEVRADTILRKRRQNRDAVAQKMDSLLTRIESASHVAPLGAVSVRLPYLKALHSIVQYRLESSIRTFDVIRADSAKRDSSNAWVFASMRKAAAQVPYDVAVPFTVVAIFVALLLLGRYMGQKIDTNRFSLRSMYKMRLVRAYLGASRPTCDRRPNPFTGFDDGDDLPIGTLWPATGAVSVNGRTPACPPMHVVNVTLNLVAGGNLAWQQRMAESMTISPLHAGCAFVGYRRTSRATLPLGSDDTQTCLYGGRDGITLGTAVTISGAAASPNAGSHSSPMVTFLMTFFNARLGAWLGNPGRAGAKSFHRDAPKQNIRPILSEMFGLTSDRSEYVYLSDGGHFENLALYEMVLRRCRFIVVSDAGCDPTAGFDDLGNAVRKIRVDLGVPIEFPDGVKIYSRDNAAVDGAGTYWAVGHIRYSAVDGNDTAASTDGILLYIKPAMYGKDEPSDVRQYAETSPTFPHESTSDQFFSESQFESYRALGEFIVNRMLATELTSSIDVTGQRQGSLLSHWRYLREASDAAVKLPSTQSVVWQTSAEKRTV